MFSQPGGLWASRILPLNFDLGQLLDCRRKFLRTNECQSIPISARLDEGSRGIFQWVLKCRVTAMNYRGPLSKHGLREARNQRFDRHAVFW